MGVADAAVLGGIVLAVGTLLATVASRLLPFGAWRRAAEDYGIVLGCAAPALALLGPWLTSHWWAAAATIGAGYGGFYLIRTRQVRRADRDGVRRLLGLHRDATFGEVVQQVERIEPRPLTAATRVVMVGGAVGVVALGVALGRFDAALASLALGAADATLRPAYRRALAARARAVGH